MKISSLFSKFRHERNKKTPLHHQPVRLTVTLCIYLLTPHFHLSNTAPAILIPYPSTFIINVNSIYKHSIQRQPTKPLPLNGLSSSSLKIGHPSAGLAQARLTQVQIQSQSIINHQSSQCHPLHPPHSIQIITLISLIFFIIFIPPFPLCYIDSLTGQPARHYRLILRPSPSLNHQ